MTNYKNKYENTNDDYINMSLEFNGQYRQYKVRLKTEHSSTVVQVGTMV